VRSGRSALAPAWAATNSDPSYGRRDDFELLETILANSFLGRRRVQTFGKIQAGLRG
jgi:hypothetical protein